MKFQNIYFATLLFFAAFAACCFGQVSTFSGNEVDWSSSNTTKRTQVFSFLEKNWNGGKNRLQLQSLAEKEGLDCEFLWKVDSTKVDAALASGSSFFTGQKLDRVEMVFKKNGKTTITLFLQGKICGRIQGWTSTKRQGEYRQLSAGDYSITGFNPNGYSKTFKSSMPNQILLSGEASERYISIHTGDISGEKEGNTYHGCIRVGECQGKKLLNLLSKGVPVKVLWVD